MGDSKKTKDEKRTKKELVAEIEDLRRRLSADEGRGTKTRSGQPTFGGDISRRDALKAAWVTPVILSVPLSMAGGSRSAHAVPVSGEPTMEPTRSPTMEPTVEPTNPPPTDPGQSEPTRAPTAFPSVADAPLIGGAGAAVAAGALFGVAVKKLLDKGSASSEDGSDDSEDSEG